MIVHEKSCIWVSECIIHCREWEWTFLHWHCPRTPTTFRNRICVAAVQLFERLPGMSSEILIEALAGHVGLSKIALHCTQIGRVGYSCTALVHLLCRPSFSLTVLDLYGNYINNEGAGILSLGGLEIVMLSPWLGGRPASIFSNVKISGLRTQIYLIIVVVEEWHYLSRMHWATPPPPPHKMQNVN